MHLNLILQLSHSCHPPDSDQNQDFKNRIQERLKALESRVNPGYGEHVKQSLNFSLSLALITFLGAANPLPLSAAGQSLFLILNPNANIVQTTNSLEALGFHIRQAVPPQIV